MNGPHFPIDPTGWEGVGFIDGDTDLCAVQAPDAVEIQRERHTRTERFAVRSWPGRGRAIASQVGGWWSSLRQLFVPNGRRAIDALVAALQSGDPMNDAPTFAARVSQEWLPIGQALDHQWGRMHRLLAAERNFAGLAAHELSGPLAGIRAQAEVALAVNEPVAMGEALQLIVRSVDRATQTLDQLLELQRIEALTELPNGQLENVALASVFERVVQEVESRGLRKRVLFLSDFAAPQLLGLEIAVHLMLRNLIANAVRHCPDGGQIEVSSRRTTQGVLLAVDDNGPGIAAQDRQRAFERFNRLGRVDPDGVGLGLSIVARAAAMLGANVELLEAPIGGLRAQVTFAAAPSQGAEHTSVSPVLD